MIESHPDNALEDLRLDRPFESLVEFMDSLNLETMTKQVWPVFQVIFADEITADDEKFSPIIDDFRDEMIEGILSK